MDILEGDFSVAAGDGDGLREGAGESPGVELLDLGALRPFLIFLSLPCSLLGYGQQQRLSEWATVNSHYQYYTKNDARNTTLELIINIPQEKKQVLLLSPRVEHFSLG